MKKKKLSAIVMYSFSDNETRETFKTELVSRFRLKEETDWLNESAWAVSYESDSTAALSDIIQKMRQDKLEIKEDDFVDLYCSAALLNYPGNDPNRDKIIRTNIL